MRLAITVCLVLLTFLINDGVAALTESEESAIAAVKAMMVEATDLYRSKQYDECGERVGEAIDQLNDLTASARAEVLAQIRETHTRADRARLLLVQQGIALPDLKPLAEVKVLGSSAATAPSSAAVEAINATVAKATDLYKQEKYDECGQQISRAIQRLNVLVKAGDPDVMAQIQKLHGRTARAAELLATQGVTVPDLMPFAKVAAASSATDRNPPSRNARASQDAEETAEEESNVSFVKDVAPILVRRCSSCHIREQKGEYSLVSFASLLEPGESGSTPIEPSQPDDSYLIELIEAGEMPPRGSLSAAETDQIREWVEAGAKYDGEDEQDELVSLVPRQDGPGAGRPGSRQGQPPRSGRNRAS